MLRKVAIIILMGLAIATILCFAVWSEPYPKQPIPQSKTGKLTKQNRSEQITPPPNFITTKKLIDAISHAIEANADKAKATQNHSPPDDSSLFTFWLVIFTGGLVVVGIVQCYIIFKTLKETQVAANAAKDSADALKSTESAYLFVMVQHPEKDGNIVKNFCDFTIINAGRTPAILTNVNSSYERIALEAAIPAITSEGDLGIVPDTIIIGTGVWDSKSFRANKSQAWGSVDERLICIGRIQYKDIFGRPHETGFCWEYIYEIGEFRPINDSKCNKRT